MPALLVLAATGSLLLAGCGKRGNPQPPLTFNPAQTTDLRGQQKGSEVHLRLSYPTTTTSGLGLAGIAGVQVWRMAMPLGGAALDLDARGFETPTAAIPLPGEELDDALERLPEAADGGAGSEEGEAEEGEGAAGVERLTEAGPASSQPAEEDPDAEAPGVTEEALAAALVGARPEEPGTQPAGAEQPTAAPAGEAPTPDDDVPAAPGAALPPPERAPIRPALFLQLAEVEAQIGPDELLGATSGDQIGLRLPLPPPSAEEPTLYAFAVQTIGLDGLYSPISNIVEIEPLDAPEPPTDLEAQAQKDGVALSWAIVGDGVGGFAIFRRPADVRLYGDAVGRVDASTRTWTDGSAIYGSRYIYTVRSLLAADETVESAPGGEVEVDYRDRFAPLAPTNVEALPEAAQVRLLWDESPDSDVVGYHVYRLDPGLQYRRVTEQPATRQEYLDRGLTSGLEYRYQVTAIDGNGNESERSVEEIVVAR